MTKRVAFMEALIGWGTPPGADPGNARLARQVNGLNLFFAFVALVAAAVLALFVPGSGLLITVQVVAATLFVLGVVLSGLGQGPLVRRSTLVVFEVQMFLIILGSRGWDSPVLTVVVVYPILAALLEVSRLRHWLATLGQVAFSFSLAGFPLDRPLSLMALVGFPLMAAGIIEILFRENQRVRTSQKSLLAQISLANRKLEIYTERLRDESMRLQAEVNIARKIQTMVLPRAEEVRRVADLEISASMITAAEVGGDYYDVIQVGQTVTIGIGDVTGHGLASGIIMLMAQTVVRTLAELGTLAPEAVLVAVNRVLYANILRIREERNMTLMLLTYRDGRFEITGQHESVLVLRNSGTFEVLESLPLGFYVGLVSEIGDKVGSLGLTLEPGELMVLYTDGITEAQDPSGTAFGEAGIRRWVSRYQSLPVEKMAAKILQAVTNHIGDSPILDDISLVLIRQR